LYTNLPIYFSFLLDKGYKDSQTYSTNELLQTDEFSVERKIDEVEDYRPPMLQSIVSETSSQQTSPDKHKDSFSSPMRLNAPQQDSRQSKDSRSDRIFPWAHTKSSPLKEIAKEFEAKYLNSDSSQEGITNTQSLEKKEESKNSDLFFLSAIRRNSSANKPSSQKKPKQVEKQEFDVFRLMKMMDAIFKIQRFFRRCLNKKRNAMQTSSSVDYTDFNSFGRRKTNGQIGSYQPYSKSQNKNNPIYIQEGTAVMLTSYENPNFNLETKGFTHESSIFDRGSPKNMFTSGDSKPFDLGPGFGNLNQSSIDFDGVLEKMERIDHAKYNLKERYGELEVHAKKIEKLKHHLEATQQLMEEQVPTQGPHHEVHQLIVEYGR
jgi:hypothetical protein